MVLTRLKNTILNNNYIKKLVVFKKKGIFLINSYPESNLIKDYLNKIKNNNIRQDVKQIEALYILDKIHQSLNNYKNHKQKEIFFFFFFRLGKRICNAWKKIKKEVVNEKEKQLPKGVYLHGPIGCGKTMIMNFFYSSLPKHLKKKRYHLHEFMQVLHRTAHEIRDSKRGGDYDLIELLANEIYRESQVLCIDEFEVTDIADAMLLKQLFMHILNEKFNVILLLTSNLRVNDLYLNGIQREQFIPCIKLIQNKTVQVFLDSSLDYRRLPKSLLPVYLSPKKGVDFFSTTFKKELEEHVKKWYDFFNQNNPDKKKYSDYTLELWGRKLRIPISSKPYVAQFTFYELCNNNLSSADFLLLAKTFNSFIVTDIPYMSINIRDMVKRFVVFIDSLYDNNRNIACTSVSFFENIFVERSVISNCHFKLNNEININKFHKKTSVPINELSQKLIFNNINDNNVESLQFKRVLSRLSQMSMREWIKKSNTNSF